MNIFDFYINGTEYQGFCRLCGKPAEDQKPIFHGYGLENNLQEKINSIFSIKVSESDPLPHSICSPCDFLITSVTHLREISHSLTEQYQKLQQIIETTLTRYNRNTKIAQDAAHNQSHLENDRALDNARSVENNTCDYDKIDSDGSGQSSPNLVIVTSSPVRTTPSTTKEEAASEHRPDVEQDYLFKPVTIEEANLLDALNEAENMDVDEQDAQLSPAVFSHHSVEQNEDPLPLSQNVGVEVLVTSTKSQESGTSKQNCSSLLPPQNGTPPSAPGPIRRRRNTRLPSKFSIYMTESRKSSTDSETQRHLPLQRQCKMQKSYSVGAEEEPDSFDNSLHEIDSEQISLEVSSSQEGSKGVQNQGKSSVRTTVVKPAKIQFPSACKTCGTVYNTRNSYDQHLKMNTCKAYVNYKNRNSE